MFNRKCIVCWLYLFFSFSLLAEEQQTPINFYSRLPAIEDPVLSPSGNRLAYIQNFSDSGLAVLVTLDLEKGDHHFLLKANNETVKIKWFRWANDEDIVVSARHETRVAHQRFYSTRLLKLDYKNRISPIQLIDWKKKQTGVDRDKFVPQLQDNVVSWLPNDPDHILVAIDIRTLHQPDVYKLNIKTNKTKLIIRGSRRIRDWVADKQGNVRIGLARNFKDGTETIYLVDQKKDYEKLYSFNYESLEKVWVVGFGQDANELYIRKYLNGFKALYKLNLITKTETLVFSDSEKDVDGSLIYSPKIDDFIGVYHSNHKHGGYYWNNRHLAFISGLEKTFPDSFSTVQSFSRDENTYIVYTSSDSQPPHYYLGDRKHKSITSIGSQYPELETVSTMLSHQLKSFTVRDGLNVESYIALPKMGKAPYPAIIFPHGGPNSRSYAGFDYWISYFTSRGYAVIRPNFRGSTGYGYDFSLASNSNWGLSMQDDITDITQLLIKDGLIEKTKLCIVGASYGGYAALMATAKTPDLFQCAVSFAGVSDLNKMVNRSRQFVNQEQVKDEIGRDRKDLRSRSAIHLIENIKTPILLVHGDEDRIVHVEQSRNFYKKMNKNKKDVTYVELPAGDHYLSIQKNRQTMFNIMDEFLSEYLH